MGGADAECRQPRELLRVGLVAFGMKQLEHAERGPAEPQRRGDGARRRKSGGVRANRPRFGERPLRNLARRTEIGRRLETPRRAWKESAVAALPEDRSGGAGDTGGEPHDLGRRVVFMKRRRERLAGQFERRACERGRVPVGCEGTKDERRLGRTQLGGEALPRSKRLAGAIDLE